ISTYELGCGTLSSVPTLRPPAAPARILANGGTSTAVPFTFTVNPSPAQLGRRTASVNFFGAGIVSEIVALSPSGKPVSILRFAPVASSAVDGTKRLTQTVGFAV